jgi:hypothetical protein
MAFIQNIRFKIMRQIMRFIRDQKDLKRKKRLISLFLLFKKKYKYDTSAPTMFKGHSKEKILEALEGDGIYNFGKVFSDAEIDRFKETLKGKQMFCENLSIPPFTEENAPADANIIYYMANDYLADDIFINLHYDPFLMDVMQDFLGCKPVINEIGLFKSLIKPEVAKKPNQKYHRDASDMRFLALALYFTDVNTSEDGPFSYVLGSAKSTDLHKAKVRYSDEEVESIFGKEKVYDVLGKRGTLVIADNSAFHRGRQPIKNERLVYFLHVGVTNVKKPGVAATKIHDADKKARLAKYSHLMDNITFDI